jgi:hypothetical protein
MLSGSAAKHHRGVVKIDIEREGIGLLGDAARAAR